MGTTIELRDVGGRGHDIVPPRRFSHAHGLEKKVPAA